jgi:predicted nucleic acid-binding protein
VTAVLLDAGPLVAYCHLRDERHGWATAQMEAVRPPMLTCEAVITEAVYLISSQGRHPDVIWEFLRRGTLQIALDLETEFESVAALMRRYANVPMDLADACLVRMSELHRDCKVLILGSDFRFYRRFGRQVIPLISPT